jgi:DNA polymerase I-like protein with 3'-5' exonuclease and polymerase domains
VESEIGYMFLKNILIYLIKAQSMIKHEMENAFPMAVPLEVEIGIGENWLEAH